MTAEMPEPEARASVARTIPGPRSFGPIEIVRYLRNPRASLQRMVARYGDPFGAMGGREPVVFTGQPDGIRAVFAANPDAFDIPFRNQVAPFLGEASLIVTSGARHRADRKLLAPPFHGARMRTYGRAIVAVANEAAADWKPGQRLNMLDVTQSISLEVILRVVFGLEEPELRERFRAAIVRWTAAMGSPLITMFEFARREFGGLGPWARYRAAAEQLDAVVFEEIAARRRHAEGRDDILSLMMGARYDDGAAMTDHELRDQLRLLLFAGHETTATALAWAMYWLHRQPDVRARVLAEIDALGPDPEPDAVAALPYLEAVCNETLRVHPVATNVARLTTAPLEIRGHVVPPGTTIQVSILLLHNDETLYPNAREFRPERFLGHKFAPYEFIPFGGGARRCLGAALAMYEMKLVLATLLRTRNFHLARGQDTVIEPEIRGVTMGPKGGVPMVFEGIR